MCELPAFFLNSAVVLLTSLLVWVYRRSPAIRARGKLFLINLLAAGVVLLIFSVLHVAAFTGVLVPLQVNTDPTTSDTFCMFFCVGSACKHACMPVPVPLEEKDPTTSDTFCMFGSVCKHACTYACACTCGCAWTPAHLTRTVFFFVLGVRASMHVCLCVHVCLCTDPCVRCACTHACVCGCVRGLACLP